MMAGIRVVFMGTPEFACPSLQKLIDRGEKLLAVVTQPDRPKGRGQKLVPPPVKVLAKRHGIPVLQPLKVRAPEFVETIRELSPDLIVVVAYGQILSPAILSIPPRGCVNVHGSLLPKYRGAAPIARALLRGEPKTGVTTMLMDAGMDTGPILLMEETEILPEDNLETLHGRLARMGARLLLKTLEGLEKGTLEPQAQDHAQATYAPKITREEGRIDWRLPARDICNLLRAFDPGGEGADGVRHRPKARQSESAGQPQNDYSRVQCLRASPCYQLRRSPNWRTRAACPASLPSITSSRTTTPATRASSTAA